VKLPAIQLKATKKGGGDEKEALEWYRAKDVIEKGFMKLKNAIDLNRIWVHLRESMGLGVYRGKN
jgi:transposase